MDASPPPSADLPKREKSSVTSSRRRQTIWQVAPNVPDRRRRIQFGIGTLLVITSIGGPLLAGAMMLPREFYQLNAQLAGAVAACFGCAFVVSYCRPRWAFAVMALTICLGFAAHVAMFTNRFHLGEAGELRVMLSAWGAMIATGIGFVLSFARHDQ